jgi:hypothetical protein
MDALIKSPAPQFWSRIGREWRGEAGEGADKATGVKWWAVFTWYQAGQEGDKMITRDLRRQGRVWRLLPAKWTSALATHTVNKFLSFYSSARRSLYMWFIFSSVVYMGAISSHTGESETRLRNLI